MEYASIEREIRIDASPEVVFDVVSSPEHLREWWPDEADFDPVPGGSGVITFDRGDAGGVAVPIMVVDAQPPRLFSFRWACEQGEVPTAENAFLVTFELVPVGGGTLVRMTETGFRDRGWEAAVLEEAYRDHVQGWDHFIPRLGAYVERLVAR